MSTLDGKVAVVTGGANGIGLAIAQRFRRDGARVAILDLLPPAEHDGDDDLLYQPCDVSRPTLVESAIDEVLQRFGQIDVLVNNAARTGGSGSFIEVSLDDWNRYLAVNLTGVFLVGQAVARTMVARQIPGSIINIGSVNSFAAERDAAPYVASKGGVLALTRAMAHDLAPYGIRVNLLAPGPIRVARNSALFDSDTSRAQFAHSIPLGGQPGEADDVAGAAAFLASDDSRFITGASLLIDGGATAIIPS